MNAELEKLLLEDDDGNICLVEARTVISKKRHAVTDPELEALLAEDDDDDF